MLLGSHSSNRTILVGLEVKDHKGGIVPGDFPLSEEEKSNQTYLKSAFTDDQL